MIQTFHVKSDADLQVPIMQALADAEKAGATELRVLIAPGSYTRGLTLAAPTKPQTLAITVAREGSGTVTLAAGISITARSIAVRDIVIDGAKPAGVALSLHAFEALEVANVALVGVHGATATDRDPLVDLVARAKGAVARIHDVWVVDCSSGAALVRVPVNGPGRWTSIDFERVAFVGNHARTGLDIVNTDSLAIRDALFVEPTLEDTWLLLGTHGNVAVERSTVAVRTALVEYRDDAAHPKIAAAGSELLAAAASAIDGKGVTWGKPPPAKLDVKAAAAQARAGGTVDRAKLRSLVP